MRTIRPGRWIHRLVGNVWSYQPENNVSALHRLTGATHAFPFREAVRVPQAG